MERQTYIKINRAYFESPFWNENRPRTKAEAYIDLFQMATVKKGRYTSLDLKNTIELTRGEGVWSIRFLSKRWHWSRGKVETFFKILKARQKIRQYLRQGVMVTFLNDYEESQGDEIYYKKDTTQDGLKTGSRQIQEVKNGKNINTNVQISSFLKRKHLLFEGLWNRYPRRLGKKEAARHFNATVKSKADWERIKTALKNYLRHIKQAGTEARYIQHGATWFNNWQDWEHYKEVKSAKNTDRL